MPSFNPSFLPTKRKWIRTFRHESEGTLFVVNIFYRNDTTLDSVFPLYATALLDLIHANTRVRRRVITIEYYPMPNHKRLPLTKGDPIGTDHVNSGFCNMNSADNDTNIVIYRKQEFYKVFDHEMIHLYDLIPADQVYQNHVSSIFEHKLPELNTNESMVEVLALIFNCIIIQKLAQEQSARELIGRELRWSRDVVQLFMRHFNIENGECVKEIATKWKETTHCFSYYVLKWLVLERVCMNLSIEKSAKVDFVQRLSKKYINMTINDIENFKLT